MQLELGRFSSVKNLPRHRGFERRFSQEWQHNPDLLKQFRNMDPSRVVQLREKARPGGDPVDWFRREFLIHLDISEQAEYEAAEARLLTELTDDLTVFYQEERKLRRQSRLYEVDPQHPLEEWLAMTQNSQAKAKSFLDGSTEYDEWKVNYIRYHRYQKENAQVHQLHAFVREYCQPTKLQAIPAGTLLGPQTVQGFTDPGKLEQLHLSPTETVLVSPKFYLAIWKVLSQRHLH